MRASKSRMIWRALSLVAAITWYSGGVARAACLSIGDVMRAEAAAKDVLQAGSDASAEAGARLVAKLDLLSAMYPAAADGGVTTIGAYVATRRMLPLIRQSAGAAAARAYAADPGFARPFRALSAPDGAADCGAGRRAPVDVAPSPIFETGARADAAQPLAPGPIGRLMRDLDGAGAPDLRYLLGFALLGAAFYLAPFRIRRDRRYACLHPVDLLTEDGAATAQIFDISRSGAKLRMPGGGPEPGRMVDLRLGGAAHWAEVRWRREDLLGVAFQRRLGAAEFRAFLRAAQRGVGAAEMEPTGPALAHGGRVLERA